MSQRALNTVRITKRAVDQLQPSDREVYIWDADVRGFGVRCYPSGKKMYVLKTRHGRTQRLITLGQHGSPHTPESARKAALHFLALRAKGEDPAAERDKRKAAKSIKELGTRFLEEYVPAHCKESTAYEYDRAVKLFINPALGSLSIADVTPADVAGFHHKLRKKPYQANRAVGVLSKMMGLAEKWGYRPPNTNPCRGLTKYKERKRERYLKADELKRLHEVLNEAEATRTENPYFIAAIRLLILTGARSAEIKELKWKYVDLINGMLNLPDSKTGKKTIPLSTTAVELLKSMRRQGMQVEGNPYVILGANSGQHLVEMQSPWRRIRKQAGLDDVRIHDLRHSFASFAINSGMSLQIVGKLLGHSQAQTTMRYAHLETDTLRRATNEISAVMDAAARPESKTAPTPKRSRVRLEAEPKRKRVRLTTND